MVLMAWNMYTKSKTIMISSSLFYKLFEKQNWLFAEGLFQGCFLNRAVNLTAMHGGKLNIAEKYRFFTQ